MSEPTAIEKDAGQIVEGACASLEACPCGCNREATAGLFAEMPDEELLFDVADLFKAFSDTTRIKILFALMGGGLSVGDSTAVVGCTHCAVSHQLRTFKQARLVKATRDGKIFFNDMAACFNISSRCATNKTFWYLAESNAAKYVFPMPVAAWTNPFVAPSDLLSAKAYKASICGPLGWNSFLTGVSELSSTASYLAKSLDTAGLCQFFEYRFN